MKTILTLDHSRWIEFYNRLSERLSETECNHTPNHAADILDDMGGIDIVASLEWMESKGGYCDCEILMNIE